MGTTRLTHLSGIMHSTKPIVFALLLLSEAHAFTADVIVPSQELEWRLDISFDWDGESDDEGNPYLVIPGLGQVFDARGPQSSDKLENTDIERVLVLNLDNGGSKHVYLRFQNAKLRDEHLNDFRSALGK